MISLEKAIGNRKKPEIRGFSQILPPEIVQDFLGHENFRCHLA